MPTREPTPRKLWRPFAAALLLLLAAYFVVAYWLAPLAWRRYEHHKGLAPLAMTTTTPQGIAGDPLNTGLEGVEADVICSFNAAGWSPADPVTLKTAAKIIGSVILNRPYRQAPVSPLLFQGRPEDLAFEKPSGASPDTRHHIRLWKVLDAGDNGAPVWLGAATFDSGVGLSHYTGQVTHHIAPDIDAERDFLSGDLEKVGKIAAIYEVSGVGPTLSGRNGGGDRFFTDGDVLFARLFPGCQCRADVPPTVEPRSFGVRLKNWLLHGALAALGRRA